MMNFGGARLRQFVDAHQLYGEIVVAACIVGLISNRFRDTV
jgi:hypothetical protein